MQSDKSILCLALLTRLLEKWRQYYDQSLIFADFLTEFCTLANVFQTKLRAAYVKYANMCICAYGKYIEIMLPFMAV